MARILAQFGALILAVWLNPFGLSTRMDASSHDVWLRLTGSLYPKDAQEKIVVVLLTDADIKSGLKTGESLTYPLAYQHHVMILEKILEQKPAVLFLDLLFDLDHGKLGAAGRQTAEQFSRIMQHWPERGWKTPVLVAGLPKRLEPGDAIETGTQITASTMTSQPWDSIVCPADPTSPSLTVLEANAPGGGALPGGESVLRSVASAVTAVTPVDWSGYGDAYPLIVRRSDGIPLLSPASEMYSRYLSSQLARKSLPEPQKEKWTARCRDFRNVLISSFGPVRVARHMPADEPPPAVLRWTANLPKSRSELFGPSECPGQESAPGNLWSVATDFLKGLFSGLFPPPQNWDQERACYGHLTLSYSEVLEAVKYPDTARLAFAGKIVIVGTRLAGVNDFAHSPVHGRVTGPHLHAMAIDNLMTFGMDYQRDPPKVLFGALSFQDLLAVFWTLVLVVVADAIRSRGPASGMGADVRTPDGRSAWIRSGIIGLPCFLTSVALVFGWQWLSLSWFSHTPANWIALLVAAMVLLRAPLDLLTTGLAKAIAIVADIGPCMRAQRQALSSFKHIHVATFR